jgi:hypothetical protein
VYEEVTEVYFKVLSWHVLGETGNTTENKSADSLLAVIGTWDLPNSKPQLSLISVRICRLNGISMKVKGKVVPVFN